jgi:hypothetical protein
MLTLHYRWESEPVKPYLGSGWRSGVAVAGRHAPRITTLVFGTRVPIAHDALIVRRGAVNLNPAEPSVIAEIRGSGLADLSNGVTCPDREATSTTRWRQASVASTTFGSPRGPETNR